MLDTAAELPSVLQSATSSEGVIPQRITVIEKFIKNCQTEIKTKYDLEIPQEYTQDSHFWYLAASNYYTQRKLLTKNPEIKLSKEDMRLQAVAQAIEPTKMQYNLEKTQAIDKLTGAWGRASLDNRLLILQQRLKELRLEGLAVMFLDIDDFKKFNDVYSHLVGDEVLKLLVEKANKYTRTGDFVARFGGEEFVILFPHNSNSEIMEERIETIRKQIIEDLKIQVNQEEVHITASAGIVHVDANHQLSDIYEKASHYLHEAKKRGKNRSYSEIIAQQEPTTPSPTPASPPDQIALPKPA